MDKSCDSSGDHSAVTASSISSAIIPATTDAAAPTTSSDKDHFLRHLNKLSHKISKPSSSAPIRRPPSELSVHLRPPPPQPGPPLQQQPPVYNINKSDFRDVVQKLTGSPAHDRIHVPQPPPPIHAPKPASSRLQRIRPPPLIQLANRPPPVLNCAAPPPNPLGGGGGGGGGFIRQPLSPLPPLPTCHAAAESPISAYMRFLRSSVSAVDSDPRFTNRAPLNPLQMIPPPESVDTLAAPSSPLPFGLLPSPKSPCPLLSSNLLLSPTGTGLLGFPQLPVSPTVPGVPSPK